MKVRVRFAKLGRVRWTSHRDVARMWERALRRAGITLAYTQGFSPRPLISFGLALPTGCESLAEYLDLALPDGTDPEPVAEVVRGLGALLPDGVDVLAAAPIPPGTASLQDEVTRCRWEILVPDVAPDRLTRAVDDAMAAPELPVIRERKGRTATDDLRPGLLRVEVHPGSPPLLAVEVATHPRGVRPTELTQAFGLALGGARRTHQWIERDGSRWEPLPVASVAEVARAS